ncbi:hypothetical protein FOA52_002145 [Chlamydomonas sp. UWO 241]|nr:hypothetical protein FOA52_002145 [Chlamydomonas sp. UWO 241]
MLRRDDGRWQLQVTRPSPSFRCRRCRHARSSVRWWQSRRMPSLHQAQAVCRPPQGAARGEGVAARDRVEDGAVTRPSEATLQATLNSVAARSQESSFQVPTEPSHDAKSGGQRASMGASLMPAWAKQQCTICFVEHVREDMVYSGPDTPGFSCASPGCGHPFCTDCMRQYVCACVDSSKYPVQCPSPSCTAALAHQDVIKLLRDSPAHLERYARLEVESAIPPSQRMYCPRKDCAMLCMRPDERCGGASVCPACQRKLRATCTAFQALPPHLRSAEDAALLNLSAALRWKKCPSCGHMVSRKVPSLDRASKVAMRCVSRTMRSLVDASIEALSSPASGFSPDALTAALVRWSGVHDLTLLKVSSTADLVPLATASLSGLTNLTVRQVPPPDEDADLAALDMMFSSTVAATLRMIDVGDCNLHSIDFVRSCVKLRCLWMPGCIRVSDLSPLAACSETLDELWMAASYAVVSLDPLRACTKLRKLDLRGCDEFELHDQLETLQLTCTQLADPASVEVEGLVHELQPNIPPDTQEGAALVLGDLSVVPEAQTAIAAAGAIPPLVRLLGRHSPADVHVAAACALPAGAVVYRPGAGGTLVLQCAGVSAGV